MMIEAHCARGPTDDEALSPALTSFCRYRYRAFGARNDISGIAPARQDPSFQNRTFDAGLGIYDYRNRSFDPATGRFLQRDPVMGGDPLYNPYCFPGNNAVSATDPMGLGDPAPVEEYLEWLQDQSDEGGRYSEAEMKPFLIKLQALKEAGYSFEIEAPGLFDFGATDRGDKKIIIFRKKSKTPMGEWATAQLSRRDEAREFYGAVMRPRIGISGAIGDILDDQVEAWAKVRGMHPETAGAYGRGQERVAEDVFLQLTKSRVGTEERAYAADKEIYEQIAYSAGTWATVKVVVGVVGGVGFFGRLLLNYGDDAARAGAGGFVDDAARAAKSGADDISDVLRRNRSQWDEYLDALRAGMSRPHVTNSELKSIMEKAYRAGATVGSGSTAAALRQELATGAPVGGRWHKQKAQDLIRELTRWVKNNPVADAADRAAAENVLKDLQNALGGR